MICDELYPDQFELAARLHAFAARAKRLRQAYAEPSPDPVKLLKQIYGRRVVVRRSDRYRGMCECGAHCWAVLTKGYVALVSPQDAWLLATQKWWAAPNPGSRVVYAIGGLKMHKLHRAILGEGATSSETDHVDHKSSFLY